MSIATVVTRGYGSFGTVNLVVARGYSLGAAIVTAALSGTILGATEAAIVAGGKTIILTLTNDTWVAAGASFDAVRQDILDGLDSAQAEFGGWNAQVRDLEAVTAVDRTSDTVVTITLSAAPLYDISAPETITATVPQSALATAPGDVTASPTFTISPVSNEERRATGGWPPDRPQNRRRTREDVERDESEALRRSRLEFGIVPLPAAQEAITQATAARERALEAKEPTQKLAAAVASMEAEQAYREAYLKVYGELVRDQLETMFRADLERTLDGQRFNLKRRAALLLLLANS